MSVVSITRSSRLRADAARVWKHATTMASINLELSPWMHMTSPAEARGLSLSDAGDRIGAPLFTSWILLGRVVPIERMEITIAELGPGFRFVERSKVRFMRSWQHARSVDALDGGSIVTDAVEAEPPIDAARLVVEAFLSRVFDHRHRRLRAIFGEA